MKREFYGIMFVIIMSLFMFNGCVANVALKENDRLSIRSVSVAENIHLPENIVFQGEGEGKEATIQRGVNQLGILGQVVGSAIIGKMTQKTGAIIKDRMKKADINIDQMLRDQFVTDLKNSKLFNEILPDERGESTFKFSIDRYGFNDATTALEKIANNTIRITPIIKYAPTITVTASLVKNSDGSVLWKKESGGNYGKSKEESLPPPYTLDEYLNDPELIRKAFTIVCGMVVQDFINDIKKEN